MSSRNVVLLTIPSSNREIFCVPSESGFTIGSNPHSKLVLGEQEGVEWDHGLLECTPICGVWVYSDLSIKGTVVNDCNHLTKSACVVEDGFWLQIGAVRINIEVYSRKPQVVPNSIATASAVSKPINVKVTTVSPTKLQAKDNVETFPSRPEFSSSPSISEWKGHINGVPRREVCPSPRENPTRTLSSVAARPHGAREGKQQKEDLRLFLANKRLAHLKDKPNPRSPIARKKIEEDKKKLNQRHRNILEQDARFDNDQEEYFKQMQYGSGRTSVTNKSLPTVDSPATADSASATFDTLMFSSVSSSAATDVPRLRRSNESKLQNDSKLSLSSTSSPSASPEPYPKNTSYLSHSLQNLGRSNEVRNEQSVLARRRSFSFELELTKAEKKMTDLRQRSMDTASNLSGKEIFLGSLDSSDQSVNSTSSHSNLQFAMEADYLQSPR